MRTDRANYGVQPTPSYDPFDTVSLTVMPCAESARGFSFSDTLTPDQADELAAELTKWAQVVRDDS